MRRYTNSILLFSFVGRYIFRSRILLTRVQRLYSAYVFMPLIYSSNICRKSWGILVEPFPDNDYIDHFFGFWVVFYETQSRLVSLTNRTISFFFFQTAHLEKLIWRQVRPHKAHKQNNLVTVGDGDKGSRQQPVKERAKQRTVPGHFNKLGYRPPVCTTCIVSAGMTTDN